MDSDEDLLLAFQRGSYAALEDLFARYHGALNSFFARRLVNHSLADDLAQDTFVALIKSKARYEPRSSVRAYLYGIAFNVLFAERRKAREELVEVESIAQSSAALPGRCAVGEASDCGGVHEDTRSTRDEVSMDHAAQRFRRRY